MRKISGVIGFGLAWIYTAAHFYFTGIRQPLTNFSGDFLASFPSWRLSVLLGRMDLYKGSLAEYWAMLFARDGHPLWHYGPVEHLVTLPMFLFSDLRSAYKGWLIANYVFLIAILWFATVVFRSDRPKWMWRSFVVIAFLNYVPLYEALTQRTIEIFELLLIFAAYDLFLRRRPAASGIGIGLAAMTKFLPLIFLPYLLVKRRFRTLASSLIVIALIAVCTEAVFGWRYSGIVVQLRAGGFSDHGELDQSLAGMVSRLLLWTHVSLSPTIAGRAVMLLGGIALAWLFLIARNCGTIADLEWGTLIVAMVLLPPHNEQYYFLLLLFPYSALLARELQPAQSGRHARRWWLAISFVLTGTVVPLSLLSELTGLQIFSVYLTLGIPFIGAAILAAICVQAVMSECAVGRAGDLAPGTARAV